MGPFQGRLARDRVIEQADLSRPRRHRGFEEKFGKLGRLSRVTAVTKRAAPRRRLHLAMASNLVDLAAVHVDDLELPAADR